MGGGLYLQNIASLFLGGIPRQEDEGVSVNILTETSEGICAAKGGLCRTELELHGATLELGAAPAGSSNALTKI